MSLEMQQIHHSSRRPPFAVESATRRLERRRLHFFHISKREIWEGIASKEQITSTNDGIYHEQKVPTSLAPFRPPFPKRHL